MMMTSQWSYDSPIAREAPDGVEMEHVERKRNRNGMLPASPLTRKVLSPEPSLIEHSKEARVTRYVTISRSVVHTNRAVLALDAIS